MTFLPDAPELGTYKISITHRDSQGADVVPKSAKWTLTDIQGAVVNGRNEIEITPLAATVIVVLSGPDLAVAGDPRRIFTEEYIYDSDEGNDLPMAVEGLFRVKPFVNV